MPLIKSGTKRAISTNIGEMIAAGHPQNQAVAAALDTARRAKMARGGSATHEGAIVSHIPGRTDKIPMDVKSGSFVIPADIVSGLGQGNTLAGIKKVQDLFEHHVSGFPAEADISEPVPIIAAGGRLPPDAQFHADQRASVILDHVRLPGFVVPPDRAAAILGRIGPLLRHAQYRHALFRCAATHRCRNHDCRRCHKEWLTKPNLTNLSHS